MKNDYEIKPVEIFIPEEDNNQDAAFRIFDNEREIFYASTRIGGLKQVEGGYSTVLPGNGFKKFAGKKYTLVTLGAKRKVHSGEIEVLSKTKNNGGKKATNQ